MSRFQLIACVLAGSAACTSLDTRSTSQPIIGGETANPADFPSVVALEGMPGEWFCTGTLITSEWVLTAAHCVDGATAADINVRFGDPDVNDAAGGTVVASAEIHEHTFDWEAWDNDIALIKLATPVTDRTPTPIHREVIPPATTVLDVGYGVADNNDGGGGLLRKVEKVTADCAGANDPGITNENLVCMDASDGRGSCFGDSGGPTFATIDGALVVAGVTSGGTGDACGAGWDLYTSIHGELAFIDAVLAGLPPPGPDPEPDPDPNPDPEPDPDPDPGAGSDDGGGCSTAGGNAGTLFAAFALWFARRRRYASDATAAGTR